MEGRFDELSLENVNTLSIHERKSKVQVDEFGAAPQAGATLADFVAGLPDVLIGRDFRMLLDRLEKVVRDRREWLLLMGGHVIKTGVAPSILTGVRRGWVTGLGMNGSAAVHDVEIALFGRTSEVVEENLADGSFGMARETAAFLNEAADRARTEGEGFGPTLGRTLVEQSAPHAAQSFLATSWEQGIPATVHVALGTDIVHQHPGASGEAIGDASLRDFRILAARVAALEAGAVLNVGSAVLMPEVFLKALTVARNLGNRVEGFSAVNFDMIRHYRPLTNVVSRPTQGQGWGAHFTGHHELLVPLLFWSLLERLEATSA